MKALQNGIPLQTTSPSKSFVTKRERSLLPHLHLISRSTLHSSLRQKHSAVPWLSRSLFLLRVSSSIMSFFVSERSDMTYWHHSLFSSPYHSIIHSCFVCNLLFHRIECRWRVSRDHVHSNWKRMIEALLTYSVQSLWSLVQKWNARCFSLVFTFSDEDPCWKVNLQESLPAAQNRHPSWTSSPFWRFVSCSLSSMMPSD